MGKSIQLKDNNGNVFPISKPYKLITNSNGNAYKFDDGLLICTGAKKAGTHNFPYPFKSIPMVTVSPISNQATAMHFSQAVASATQITIINGWASQGGTWSTDGAVSTNYIAVGLWK